MVYDPDNAIEENSVSIGIVSDAKIIDIKDGIVSDFVKDGYLKKFKNPISRAIYVVSEGMYDDKRYRCETLFTYRNDEKNGVVYDAKSNLSNFKKMYGYLPKVGQLVKHVSVSTGYFRLMINDKTDKY